MSKKSHNTHKPEKIKAWQYFAIGAIVGLVIALLLISKIYCLNAFQPETTSIFPGLTAFGGVLTALSSLRKDTLFGSVNLVKKYKKFFLTIGGVLLIGAATAWLSPLFYRFDKNYCVSDFEKLVALTDQEGVAVITEDMDIIHEIYTSSAVVTKVDSKESWQAYTAYSLKFAQEEHCTNSHSDYDVLSYTEDEVVMTTSSQGTWGGEGQGCNQSFSNPAGSDQWTFKKIEGGWKIVNFEFNRPVDNP